eukprot:10673829-Karenia_brevis.AAC.1
MNKRATPATQKEADLRQKGAPLMLLQQHHQRHRLHQLHLTALQTHQKAERKTDPMRREKEKERRK